MRLCFSVESAEHWEKQQKVATPLLFDHLEQACLELYPKTKYHIWNYNVLRYLKGKATLKENIIKMKDIILFPNILVQVSSKSVEK